MTTKTNAYEPVGSRKPDGPVRPFEHSDLGDLDLGEPVRAADNCCVSGHQWPPYGHAPCEKCGKESSIPHYMDACRHGSPLGGKFGGHDCAYSDARDVLTEYAATAADRDCVAHGSTTSTYWDRQFHFHMDRLVAAARGTR